MTLVESIIWNYDQNAGPVVGKGISISKLAQACVVSLYNQKQGCHTSVRLRSGTQVYSDTQWNSVVTGHALGVISYVHWHVDHLGLHGCLSAHTLGGGGGRPGLISISSRERSSVMVVKFLKEFHSVTDLVGTKYWFPVLFVRR